MTPEWPSSINHLAERGSFRMTPGEPPLRSEFDYGPARMRRRFTSDVTTFSFSVILTEEEHARVEGFWRDNLRAGTAWFNMPVYLGRNGYEVRRVRFTQPYQVNDAGFRHVKVSANLETRGAAVIDGGTVWFVNEFGEDAIGDLNDPLGEAVNETYPATMENY